MGRTWAAWILHLGPRPTIATDFECLKVCSLSPASVPTECVWTVQAHCVAGRRTHTVTHILSPSPAFPQSPLPSTKTIARRPSPAR